MGRLKKHFNRTEPNMPLIVALLIVFALATMVLAAGIGPVSVHPVTTAKLLLSRIPGVGGMIAQTWEQLDYNIVFGLRLPRVCLGMVVGASLAVCGVAMQALVRNNLADPFLLGVSNGAAAFATLGMLFGAELVVNDDGTTSFIPNRNIFLAAFIAAVFIWIVLIPLFKKLKKEN